MNVNITALDYERVRSKLFEISGIDLGAERLSLVESRLGSRLRELNLQTFGDYLSLVDAPESEQERTSLVDLLTTNVTQFFREEHHLEHFTNEHIPSGSTEGVRIWSAGCSSGQEPYSIAMSMVERLDPAVFTSTLILATDISTRVLKTAQSATYSEREVKEVSPARRQRFFERTGDRFTLKQAIRDRVRIRQLNLMESWPMRGPFDAIFCRNVMIYFNAEQQERLVNKYASLLRPGGVLYVGHSESLASIGHPLETVGPTIYQRRMET